MITPNDDVLRPKRLPASHFGDNIKLLRKRKNLSQEDVALTLSVSRSTVKNYENNTASPKIDKLISFADFFNISIDTLLRINLGGLREYQLTELDHGFNVYVSSSKLRVLAKTVDAEEQENIELVPEKAEAGYTTGYADPEYISQLPAFTLPFLSREKKYRAFQITGDSMLPIPSGSHIIGEYIENWYNIKNNEACIVVTENDGIVFKLITNNIETDQSVTLSSLNTAYDPFVVPAIEVQEMWSFVNYISEEMPEGLPDIENMAQTVSQISIDVNEMKAHIIPQANREIKTIELITPVATSEPTEPTDSTELS